MTPTKAKAYRDELYAGHPAAVFLMKECWHSKDAERRRRSAVALAALDPDVPLVVIELMAQWAGAQVNDVPDTPAQRRAA